MMRPLLGTLVLACTLAAGCGGPAGTSGRGFALSWKIADAAAPDPQAAPALRCADAGVTSVRFDALDRASNRRRIVDFGCDTMGANTPPMAESNYQIFLSALDGGGTSKSQIRFDADNFDDIDADLGLVIFTVNLR